MTRALAAAVRLVAVAADPPAVPLTSLLIPFFGLVLAAAIAAVGSIIVARYQSRPNTPDPGAPVFVTIEQAELRDLRQQRDRLSVLVAATPSLSHIDPTTGLPR